MPQKILKKPSKCSEQPSKSHQNAVKSSKNTIKMVCAPSGPLLSDIDFPSFLIFFKKSQKMAPFAPLFQKTCKKLRRFGPLALQNCSQTQGQDTIEPDLDITKGFSALVAALGPLRFENNFLNHFCIWPGARNFFCSRPPPLEGWKGIFDFFQVAPGLPP